MVEAEVSFQDRYSAQGFVADGAFCGSQMVLHVGVQGAAVAEVLVTQMTLEESWK